MPIELLGYDCFISHSHKDARDYALKLRDRLEERGITTCLDATEFEVGEPLEEAMLGRVRASSFVVYLDTPGGRRSFWVARELVEALANKKHVARIRFPAVADPDEPWHQLDSLKGKLEGLLSLSEALDASATGPSERVLNEFYSRHRNRRVKRRVGQFLALAAALVVLWVTVTTVSAIAHSQAGSAAREFQNPNTSLLAARQNASSILASFSTLIYEVFAEREFWYVRKLAAETNLKPSATEILPTENALSCAMQASPASLPRSVSCVAESRPHGVAVYAKRVSASDDRQRIWISNGSANLVSLGEREPFERAAVSLHHFATASSAGFAVRRWSPSSDLPSIQRDERVLAMRFSSDARILWLLVERASPAALVLSALDPESGKWLAEHGVDANSMGSADDPRYSLEERENLVGVCGRTCAVFEHAIFPRRLQYETSVTRRGGVTGVAVNAEGGIAYSTLFNSVGECRRDGQCREVKAGKFVGIGKLRVIGLGPSPANQYPFQVFLQRTDSVIGACKQVSESEDAQCDEMRSAASGLAAPDGTPLLIAADGPVPFVIPWNSRQSTQLRGLGDEARLDRLMAVTSAGWYIEAAGTTVRVTACGQTREIPLTDYVPLLHPTATITAAALSPSGCQVALAFDSSAGSFVYVEDKQWLGWRRSRWYGLGTVGPVLAMRISDCGDELTLVERLDAGLIRRTFNPRVPAAESLTEPGTR